MQKNSLFLIPLMALIGCSAVVNTPYQAPPLDLPQQFSSANSTTTQQTEITDKWWQAFQDPQLNALVQQVFHNNPDLSIVLINLQKARLQAGLVDSQQGLRVGANASTGHSLNLGSGDEQSKGLTASANVSYELDLFGKLQKQSDVAQFEALASEFDVRAAQQSLAATVCNLYWQSALLNSQYQLNQANLASSEKTYQLVQSQYKAGAVSRLELTQAEQAIQSQKNNLSQIAQQRLENQNALALLLNQPLQQSHLPKPSLANNPTLPQVDAGLPAQLLARRPDLQAAELRLRKALAQSDATRASYYPSISLTGALGVSSTSLTQLLKNPLLTLGANLSLPFLQYNDMRRNLAISQLDYEQAIIGYRKTLYQALTDVDNALSQRTQLIQQVTEQQKNVQLSQDLVRLNEARYRYGAVPLKNVLDAQANLRSAQLSLAQLHYQQYIAAVTLMQNLGGSTGK